MSDIKQIFSRNLNAVLDGLDHPKSGFGRVSRLAEMFDMSRASAQKWLTEGCLPDPSRYPELTAKLKCSLDDLFSESGPSTSAPASNIPVKVITCSNTEVANLPQQMIQIMRWPEGAILVSIRDSSMEPYVVKGDFVAFDALRGRYAGDGNYVVFHNNTYVVRRIRQLSNGNYRLSCNTQKSEGEELDAKKVKFGLPPQTPGNKVFLAGQIICRILVHR